MSISLPQETPYIQKTWDIIRKTFPLPYKSLPRDSHSFLNDYVSPPYRSLSHQEEPTRLPPDYPLIVRAEEPDDSGDLALSHSSGTRNRASVNSEARASIPGRRPQSGLARAFWTAVGSRFSFSLDATLLSSFMFRFESLLNPNPLASDEFRAQLGWNAALLEGKTSRFTASGAAAILRSQGFDTYEDRGHWNSGRNFVEMLSRPPDEVAETGAFIAGLGAIATNMASNMAIFCDEALDIGEHGYIASPLLQCGILDVSSRPVLEEKLRGVQLDKSTKLGFEKKLLITERDWLCLVFALVHGAIVIEVLPNSKGRLVVKVVDPQFEVLLSAALKIDLAQVAQEFHTNKAENIVLATHDINILFSFSARGAATASRLFFRDPAQSKKFRDRRYLDSVLALIPDPIKSAMMNDLLDNPGRYFEEQSRTSLLKIMVAGLVLSPDSGRAWMSQDELRSGLLNSTVSRQPSQDRRPDTNQDLSGTPGSHGSAAHAPGDRGPTERSDIEDPRADDEDCMMDALSAPHQDLSSDSDRSGGQSSQLGIVIQASFDPNRDVEVIFDPAISNIFDNFDLNLHYVPLDFLPEIVWSPIPTHSRSLTGSSRSSADSAISIASDADDPMPVIINADEQDHACVRDSTEESQIDAAHPKTLETLVPQINHRPILTHPSSTDLRQTAPTQSSILLRQKVTVTRYISSGRLWDTYRANLGGTYPGIKNVVVKICAMGAYPPTAETDEEYTFAEAEEAVAEELLIFASKLTKLQGTLVPTLVGGWRSEIVINSEVALVAPFNVLILEDCGEEWLRALRISPTWIRDGQEMTRIPSHDKNEIVTAYKLLHSAGVVHDDVSPRHIFRHPVDGKVRLIDFEGSRRSDLMTPEEWSQATRKELTMVMTMLGLSESLA